MQPFADVFEKGRPLDQQFFLKETPTQVIPKFLDITKFLRVAFLQNNSGCLFFDFAPQCAFNFDQKLYTKRYTNNSLL